MSIYFQNANSEYTDIGGTSSAIANVNGSTLCAWCYANDLPNSTNTVVVLTTDDVSKTWAKISVTSAGALRGAGRCATGDTQRIVVSSDGEFIDDTQFHLAFTFNYSTSTISLYKNGAFVTSGAVVWSAAPSSNVDAYSVFMGGHPGYSEYWDGYVGDCRIYNRVLTVSEISSIYRGHGADSIVYGLRHRWRNLTLPNGSSVVEEKDMGPLQQNHSIISANPPIYAEGKINIHKR